MKKNVIIALVLAFAAPLLYADGHRLPKSIRIATEGAYPPFNTKDASGKLGGFDVDIGRALCQEMAIECTFVAQDWDGIIPALLAKKYDAIIASMSITEERLKKIAFTERYYSNYLRFATRKGNNIIDTADLHGKTVGAQRATLAAQWLEDNLGKKATVKLYDKQIAAYADMNSGRLDALLSDAYPLYDWLRENPKYGYIGDKIDLNDRIGIALRKNNKALQKAFNKALQTIRANGRYAEINARYFPFDIY